MHCCTNSKFPSVLILEVKQGQVEELLTYAVPISFNDCSVMLAWIVIQNHFLLSELPKRNLKNWKGPRVHIIQREDQRKHPNSVWSLEEHDKKQLLVQSTMWTLHDCVTVSMSFDVLCVQQVIYHHLVSSSDKILCAGCLVPHTENVACEVQTYHTISH